MSLKLILVWKEVKWSLKISLHLRFRWKISNYQMRTGNYAGKYKICSRDLKALSYYEFKNSLNLKV